MPATLGRRFLAFALDLILISGLTIAMFAGLFRIITQFDSAMPFLEALVAYGQGEADPTQFRWIILTVFSLAVVLEVLFHGYFIYFEYRLRKTPGKWLLGIEVISSSGQDKLTLRQVVVRELFRYVDCWLIIPGVVAVLASPEGQRIGDRMAKTQVRRRK